MTIMDLSLINSQSLLRLLALTEKKEELIGIVKNIDAAIIDTLKSGVLVEVVEVEFAPESAAPDPKPMVALKAPAKPSKAKKSKKKSGISPEGRAKLAANMKARWAAKRAGKPAAKIGKPAKKGFKLPTKA